LVTIDAMGCQVEIARDLWRARRIRANLRVEPMIADAVLALKVASRKVTPTRWLRWISESAATGSFYARARKQAASNHAADYRRRRPRRRVAGGSGISYRHIDIADRPALMTLGVRGYDAAVCKMALMDMAVIHPLLAALAELLKPGGRFVFSVLHPAFNSIGTSLWMEETTAEAGELVVSRGVTPDGSTLYVNFNGDPSGSPSRGHITVRQGTRAMTP
jgi:hypothetical protein